MRVAVIVLTMVVATPSGASQSCMSKTEARQHFGSTYIYWHGPDHCWDATPTRHHQIQVRRKTLVHQVRQKIDQPQWREADVRDVASRPTYSDASDANVRGCSLRWRRCCCRWPELVRSLGGYRSGRATAENRADGRIANDGTKLRADNHDRRRAFDVLRHHADACDY